MTCIKAWFSISHQLLNEPPMKKFSRRIRKGEFGISNHWKTFEFVHESTLEFYDSDLLSLCLLFLIGLNSFDSVQFPQLTNLLVDDCRVIRIEKLRNLQWSWSIRINDVQLIEKNYLVLCTMLRRKQKNCLERYKLLSKM